MVPADSARISRVPAYSGAASDGQVVFAYGAFTRCGPTFQTVPLTSDCSFIDGPTTPHDALPRLRFGLLRVRSPLLAQSLVCFLFLRVLRCFSSPGSPPSSDGCRSRLRRVAPFGHPRFTGYLLLLAAFRSLSRPSSPPRA